MKTKKRKKSMSFSKASISFLLNDEPPTALTPSLSFPASAATASAQTSLNQQTIYQNNNFLIHTTIPPLFGLSERKLQSKYIDIGDGVDIGLKIGNFYVVKEKTFLQILVKENFTSKNACSKYISNCKLVDRETGELCDLQGKTLINAIENGNIITRQKYANMRRKPLKYGEEATRAAPQPLPNATEDGSLIFIDFNASSTAISPIAPKSSAVLSLTNTTFGFFNPPKPLTKKLPSPAEILQNNHTEIQPKLRD